MRQIVAGLFMTLDGVVEEPEAWTGPYFNDELGQEIGSMMAAGDTLLLGRKTYETFAASFSGQSGGMADAMNHTPKVVVSTTLASAEWQNSTILDGDLAEGADRLKQQPGKNINISGSATLNQRLQSYRRIGLSISRPKRRSTSSICTSAATHVATTAAPAAVPASVGRPRRCAAVMHPSRSSGRRM